MSSVLQQTLRGLCVDTGWCYAVFWKLKQRSRTVLTWEDAFYEHKMEDIKVDSLPTITAGFGQQICGGLAEMQDPIGLSVAKMSYHVYSVGEGIIGRVAFTNKHQWVFSLNDKRTVANGVPDRKTNARAPPEKYPSGWEQQFAAGIETIAVVAVPQGVLQLGSTHVILEDLKLIEHVKALFGTLQNVPGAFLSDFVSDVQKGTSHTVYPSAVPALHLPPRDSLSMHAQSPTVARTPSLPANMGLATAGGAAFHTDLGCSGVGRLPMMLASQQILTYAHPWHLPPVPGFQENILRFQHSLLAKPGSELLSQSSFPFFEPSIGAPTLSTVGGKVNPPPRTGIITHLSLSSKASSVGLPVSIVPSSFSADSSLSVSASMLELPTTHGQNGLVSTTKSPGPVDGNQVAAELSDIASSIKSQKADIRTMKEDLVSVAGISGLGNTRGLGCEGVVKGRQLLGARPAAEQPCSRLLGKSLSVGLGRIFPKSLQADSIKPLAKFQQLGNGRSTESQTLNSPSVDAGHLQPGHHGTEKGPGVVSNRLARESGQIISLLPITESSLLRPASQSCQYFDKHKNSVLQSRQFGGANFAIDKMEPVSERSSMDSPQPQENISPTSMFSRGLSMCLERSTSSTIRQESCMSAKTSALQCEQSMQTFATDNSQISDLLQLAKEFDNADRDKVRDFSCSKADLHQCISSSLLFDDYFEDLQSSKQFFQNVELNAWDSGSADNSMENLFSDELNNFDEFFAWLTKAEKSKSETLSQPVTFASTTSNDEILASLSTQGYGSITKGKEYFNGSNALPCQFAITQPECEPTLHTPFSNCFVKELTFSCKEMPSIQSEPQYDRKWQLCLLQKGHSKL